MTPLDKLNFFHRCTRQNLYVPPFTFGRVENIHSLSSLQKIWNEATAEVTNVKAETSLYIHVPFCHRRRCTFCMYNSSVDYTHEVLNAYRDNIKRTFKSWENNLPSEFRNFYVGGGTPSVYSAQELHRFLFPFTRLKFVEKGERTCEMSPTTATEEHIKAIADCGFNRLSLGVQSFDTSVLDAINREHVKFEYICKLCSCARRSGLIDINLDLMLGIPKLTRDNIKDSVRKVINSGAISASIYYWRQTPVSREDLITQFHVVKEEMLNHGWRLESGSDQSEHHLFFSPESRNDTLRYVTSPNCVDNQRVIGLGLYANGFRPSLAYSCRSDNQYKIWRMDTNRQLHMAAANMLYYCEGRINKKRFKEVLGAEVCEVFARELDELRSIGGVEETQSEINILGKSGFESNALQKFFWDFGWLEEWSRRNGGA